MSYFMGWNDCLKAHVMRPGDMVTNGIGGSAYRYGRSENIQIRSDA